MMLFPITSPRSGLYISSSRLCVADIKKSFREPRLVEYREHPLPDHCLQLSSSTNNLSDSDQFLMILETLIPLQKRPQSIALALPDICTRTAVFDFSKIPKKKKEQQSLIAWRMEKDFHITTSKARVSYQIFPPRPATTSGSEKPLFRVIATAIQNSIIESFENLCLRAGLAPMSIHMASMSAFNLCQDMFDSTCSLLSEKVEVLSDQRVLIYMADWGYTVLIFGEGNPAFIRIKPTRLGPLQPLTIPSTEGETTAQEPTPSDNSEEPGVLTDVHNPQPPQPQARTLANELIGTMQHYFETQPCSAREGSMIPVFLCGTLSPDTLLPAIADIIDKEFPMAGEGEKIAIKAFPVIPGNGSLPSKSIHGLSTWTSNTLSTLGAVLTAS